MKFIKKFVLWLIAVLAVIVALLYIFKVDYLITAVRKIYCNGHVTAFLDDYTEFENRTIPKSHTPQPWPIAKGYNDIKPTEKLEKWNKELGTVSFLIFKNDSLWSENYYDNYTKDTKSNSFSMAKSVVSAALGKAIMQGKIKSLGQPVSDFFPQFKQGKSTAMTVGDLSSMASGLDWDESYYSPFSITTQAYFDEHLDKVILTQKAIDEPGKAYKYLSGNTQLLTMIIEKRPEKASPIMLLKIFGNRWAPKMKRFGKPTARTELSKPIAASRAMREILRALGNYTNISANGTIRNCLTALSLPDRSGRVSPVRRNTVTVFGLRNTKAKEYFICAAISANM
jgi:hypothetical protein